MQNYEYYSINSACAGLFSSFLPQGNLAIPYLKQRNVSHETIERFQIGLGPTTHQFKHDITNCGYEIDGLRNLGLINKNGNFPFALRIIFPIRDVKGRICGFGGRWINKDFNENTPKYINSRDSPIYRKAEILYGLYEALPAIRLKRRAILVEGYFDVVLMSQAGFGETVGVCGTSLTDYQLYLLKLLGVEVFALFDGDLAGAKAAAKFETLTEKHKMKYKVINLNSVDPAELVMQHGINTIEDILRG